MAAQRLRMLNENYIKAKYDGHQCGDYDIALVDEDSFEEYYILLQPKTGIYRDQPHILHMKTSYGRNGEYSYPMQAPLIKFLTEVYHTNISTSGSICLDILKETNKWMPTYDFKQIILNLMVLYLDPNTSSPFNTRASLAYSKSRTKFRAAIADYKKAHGSMPTIEEEENIKNRCFADYKHKADVYATRNDLMYYVKWFPQLKTGTLDDSEVKETADMYNMLVEKEKKRENDKAAKKTKNKSKKWAKFQKKKKSSAATKNENIDDTKNVPESKSS